MAEPRESPGLARLERWMLEVISHPDGVEAGFRTDAAAVDFPRPEIDPQAREISDIIEPSNLCTPAERLSVYANAYFWRLVDTLADDYSIVRDLIGKKLFYDTAVDYLRKNPSRHYSLSMLGAEFPAYLRRDAEPLRAYLAATTAPVAASESASDLASDDASADTAVEDSERSLSPFENRQADLDFVCDVALVERSIQEVFDAPRTPQLAMDDLLSIPMDDWGRIRFHFIEACQLHRLSYPVSAYMQSLKKDAETPIPAREESWVAVFRKDFRTWRIPLTLPQFALLTTLAAGRPLGEALEECIAHDEVDADEVIGSLKEWFQVWTAEGWFAAVDLAGN